MTADAPVLLRARPDLIVRPQMYRARRHWCIKDPVSLAYFHLSDEEYALLELLDGRASLTSIRDAFQRRFPHLELGTEQLRGFLAGLYRNGLVTAEANGEGERLWTRRRTARRRMLLRALPSVLALRFRGIDPSRLLRVLDDQLWWLFSPVMGVLAALFILAAGTLVAIQFDVFRAALPRADTFFTAGNLLMLFAAIGIVKVLHELGHGVSCVRYGGECHEMGVMLLVFTPCLYCDVSDSWMFPEKRRRIAVAAAGIAVELMLAAAATFAWWFSEPGVFQAFCLNVMLVCSVNTIWFNGNPLLRYDGYFILSDLLEIPNLAAESQGALMRLAFGREAGDPPLADRRELTLLTYAVASAAYRIFLTAVIVWICFKLLTPLGLAPAAYLLAIVCVVALAAGPVAATASAMAGGPPRRGRALVTLAIIAALGVAAAAVPLPQQVEAVAVLQPRGAARVYASVGGTLRDAITAGTAVTAGDVVAQLDDPALERAVLDLEGRQAELTARLSSLESRRLAAPAVAGEIPATRQALESIASQLAMRRRDLAELRLVAPKSGVVLPPPTRPAPRLDAELAEWSGSPLEERNQGCRIEAGTLICLVGDPRDVEAVLYVVEDDVSRLRLGQPVRLLLEQRAADTLTGVIEAIAADPLRIVPPELARTGRLAARGGDDGLARPTETVYEVRVQLDEAVNGASLRIRGVGWGQVATGSATLAERIYRFARRTFRFDL